jgi:arginyl-tRNA synthetase
MCRGIAKRKSGNYSSLAVDLRCQSTGLVFNLLTNLSFIDFTQLYERLDVTLIERGESFYQSRMVEFVQLLEEKGLLQTEEGRKLFWPTDSKFPLIIVKSDGGFTYDTSDMATIKQRIFEEKADWILYVVDIGQSEHFKLIFSAALDLGWYTPEEKRVEHVQFGLVLGEDG